MYIGSKLKNLRKDKKLSQRKLADRTGISYSFLSDIENERSNPSFDKLNTICKVLNVEPSYFLMDKESGEEVQKDPLQLELKALLYDFDEWNVSDKQELIAYLNAKRLTRK